MIAGSSPLKLQPHGPLRCQVGAGHGRAALSRPETGRELLNLSSLANDSGVPSKGSAHHFFWGQPGGFCANLLLWNVCRTSLDKSWFSNEKSKDFKQFPRKKIRKLLVITACWYRIHVPEKHQNLKYYFKIYIKSLVASLAGDIFDCSSLHFQRVRHPVGLVTKILLIQKRCYYACIVQEINTVWDMLLNYKVSQDLFFPCMGSIFNYKLYFFKIENLVFRFYY